LHRIVVVNAVNTYKKFFAVKFDKLVVTAANPFDCGFSERKRGGSQYLQLGRNCANFGIIAHELGHALGLIHTMNRHDRDKYVTVKFNNMPVILFEFEEVIFAKN
ncbi:astacin, partial [Oesophagostomum dentatum]